MNFANLKSLTIPEGVVRTISINGQIVADFSKTQTETNEPVEEEVITENYETTPAEMEPQHDI